MLPSVPLFISFIYFRLAFLLPHRASFPRVFDLVQTAPATPPQPYCFEQLQAVPVLLSLNPLLTVCAPSLSSLLSPSLRLIEFLRIRGATRAESGGNLCRAEAKVEAGYAYA